MTSTTSKVKKEAFWPSNLDQECDKAARILKSFCSDGCLAPLHDGDSNTTPTTSVEVEPQSPLRIMKRIPKRIIQNAAGIAIFTCMRSGLWMTGSGGSGILIARKADGTWSPPSALLLHTPTLSFIMGVDIYDCVLVINNLSALESLIQPRVTLGEDVGLCCGPMLPHGSSEEEIKWKDLGNTVFTYLKARGQVQPVNLNGCMLVERGNENERFYSAGNLTMMDILAGNVNRNVDETRGLFEVIKQAEGRSDFDAALVDQISAQCAPGDALIESPKSSPPMSPRTPFGVPNADDPDPFGVLALEMAGLEIREAGTHLRPTSSQFEFNPTPTSPLSTRFNLKRQSNDTLANRSNRGSCLSVRSNMTHTTDAGTQTQTDLKNTPLTTPLATPGNSHRHSEDARDCESPEKTKALEEVAEEEVDYTKIDFSPIRQFSNPNSLDGATMTDSPSTTDDDRHTEQYASCDETATSSTSIPPDSDGEDVDEADDADDEDDDVDGEEEPVVVFEVASAVQPVRRAVVTSSQAVQVKGSIVTIPKRIPPPLPLRNPARKRDSADSTAMSTPARSSFAVEDRLAICPESAASKYPAEIEQLPDSAIEIQDTPTPTPVSATPEPAVAHGDETSADIPSHDEVPTPTVVTVTETKVPDLPKEDSSPIPVATHTSHVANVVAVN